jgi:phosphatidylglycerophosphatase A
MIILVIYIIGFIITYYMLRKDKRKESSYYSWDDVLEVFFLSVVWPGFWVLFLIGTIALVIFNSEPPKWL